MNLISEALSAATERHHRLSDRVVKLFCDRPPTITTRRNIIEWKKLVSGPTLTVGEDSRQHKTGSQPSPLYVVFRSILVSKVVVSYKYRTSATPARLVLK